MGKLRNKIALLVGLSVLFTLLIIMVMLIQEFGIRLSKKHRKT